MQVVICANENQKKELLSNTIQEGTSIIWISDINEMAQYKDSEVLIDLLFENTHKRIQ